MIYFKSRDNKGCNGFVSKLLKTVKRKLIAIVKVFKEPGNV